MTSLCTHMHTHTFTRTRTHTHARARTHTQTNAHHITHANASTQTHTNNTISFIEDDKNKDREVSADTAATETYYMMGINKI